MKTLWFIVCALIGLTSCGNRQNTPAQTPPQERQQEYVEVLYFHGKPRCVTCNAIEKLTKEVIEENFAAQLKKGEVLFQVIDITTPEGEKIADKYEVTWSSLYINQL
ncbi:MAG: nitrophenyl compound nitroreductase subunit ArsF family protein, partial [Alistipes sp.]|nr:nitrophenyl compound nitroreductase subunit ArsF family protein [Alistipes sp.]